MNENDMIESPPRPVKRFRNNSSPFRGAAESDSNDSKPCWQWKSGMDDWLEYSPQENDLIETAFCVEDIVSLPRAGEYIVDLRRFLQINVQTGKERPVRRILKSTNGKPPQPAITSSRVFEGRRTFLNKLPGATEPHGTLSFRDVVGDKSDIESVLLTSYGTDIEWLLSHFEYGTHITLVDQPTSDSHGTSFVPLGNLWPGFQVIHPKFEKGGLFESGTMHCKLILILRKSGSLRICISSANLAQFDWEGITQILWLIDIDVGVTASSSLSSFGADLSEFVSLLLKDQELVTDWNSILKKFEPLVSIQVPQNIQLIASVPGTHAGKRRNRFGQLRLRSVLDSHNIANNNTVLFQVSSIGMLQTPFMLSLIESAHASSFQVVWPTYEHALSRSGNDHMMLYEKNEKAASKFLTPLVPLDSRKDVLNHSKVMTSKTFTYMGSHNLSMSAWGRLVYEQSALQIASFELGIVIIHDSAIGEVTLPFQPGTSPMTTRPWMLDRFLRKVSSGTESLSLSELDKLNPKKSLGDHLSNKGQKSVLIIFKSQDGILHQFIENSLRVRSDMEVYEVEPGSDYSTHLASYFSISTWPTIVVLAPGSGLGSHVKILKRIESLESILGTDLDSLIVVSIEDEDEVLIEETPLLKKLDESVILVCLDIDGTIVESNTSSVLLPGAAAFFASLDPAKVKVALVTNQGGVGLKHWMTVAGFGDPSSYPSQSEVEGRIQIITEKIKSIFPGHLNVFMAFRYQSKGNGRWGPVPFNSKDDPKWSQEWRKPNPGMIHAAMKWAGIGPFDKKLSKVLMVGDMDTDEAAAKAAGVGFKRAPDFFI